MCCKWNNIAFQKIERYTSPKVFVLERILYGFLYEEKCSGDFLGGQRNLWTSNIYISINRSSILIFMIWDFFCMHSFVESSDKHIETIMDEKFSIFVINIHVAKSNTFWNEFQLTIYTLHNQCMHMKPFQVLGVFDLGESYRWWWKLPQNISLINHSQISNLIEYAPNVYAIRRNKYATSKI